MRVDTPDGVGTVVALTTDRTVVGVMLDGVDLPARREFHGTWPVARCIAL
jgi:hypothetical protein